MRRRVGMRAAATVRPVRRRRKEMVWRRALWHHPGMRLLGRAWILVVASVAACGGDPVRTPRGDGVLVLEVGGAQPSLRSALSALGRSVEAPHRLSPLSEVSSKPVMGALPPLDESAGPEAQQQQQQSAPPEPEIVPEIAPEPEWVTVPLPKGETLIHVARRHLGDGRRYVDLLEWNGWSDADARKLSPDTPVRIKRAELRQR
ncbi:MAG: hypothetical protein H6835_19025 [Planctomycetes bacterium]|nr:hypothetical protein [Planctomycetota bacterium]